MAVDKKHRREEAIRKSKRKRNIIIAVVSATVLALAAAIIFTVVLSAGTYTYTDGIQILTLHPDGTFTAILYHGERYTGSFVRHDDRIELTYGGDLPVTANARLDGDSLTLPLEWDDSHNHGRVLTLR